MEIGAEISIKIRAAIKAKLVDLGAYVDDELPDYVMVMVANKKTQAQMTEDLNLFLGNNTEVFTVWLSLLLEKLQTIAADSSENQEDSQQIVFEETKAEIESTSTVKTDTEVLYKPPEKVNITEPKKEEVAIEPDIVISVEKDEFAEEAQETKPAVEKSPVGKQAKPSPPRPKERIVQKKSPVVVKRSPGGASVSDPPRAIVRAVPSPVRKITSQGYKRGAITSSNHRRGSAPESVVGSVVKHDVDEEEEEYDPYHPAIGTVASVVRVTERKSSVPPSLQASKSLLLRAVKDAHVSIAKTTRKQVVEPTVVRPILQRIGTATRLESPPLSDRLLRTSTPKVGELYTKSKRQEIMQRFKDQMADEEEERSVYIVREERKLTGTIQGDSRLIESTDSATSLDESEILIMESGADDSDFVEIAEEHTVKVSKPKKQEPQRLSSPKFVVTLEGVDPHDYEGVSEEDIEEINRNVRKRGVPRQQLTANLDDDEDMISPPKLQKLERCRFWPNCKNGDQCSFHHPSVDCKSFPNCSFRNKCLYIHPNCKFDARCNNPDCAFTHTSRRPLGKISQPTVVIQPIKVPVFATPTLSYQKPSHPSQVKCKFYPKCTNMSCPFLHPKPCRFGIGCNNKALCLYSHPELPSKDRLKWAKTIT